MLSGHFKLTCQCSKGFLRAQLATPAFFSKSSHSATALDVINTALASIDDLTSNTVTATNVSFQNATTTNLRVPNLAAALPRDQAAA